MNTEQLKPSRNRLPSEAITLPEEPTQSTIQTSKPIQSVQFKPLEDPELPPELSLQDQYQKDSNQSKDNEQKNQASKQMGRSRTKSEDCEYTILGFLQKKIKTRLLSEQITDKLTIFPPKHDN